MRGNSSALFWRVCLQTFILICFAIRLVGGVGSSAYALLFLFLIFIALGSFPAYYSHFETQLSLGRPVIDLIIPYFLTRFVPSLCPCLSFRR
jgi:hypothetical protein